MHVKTYKLFNQFTQQAMFDKVSGYIDKTLDVESEIKIIKQKYNLDKIYRFDLGENSQGCSPRIKEFLNRLQLNNRLALSLNRYPDRTHNELKEKLAEKFQVPMEWILISAGLDSILDLITRVFFEYRDMFLMPVPSFYLFEEYSERMGGIPIFLELEEKDEFGWTAQTTETYKSLVSKFRPKIVWIANPNNPTGQFIPLGVLEELIEFAHTFNAFIVVDEAYGEYTDTPERVLSASRFVRKYNNLMVLRTFSKKYGLASIRVGYMICSSKDILEAMLIHRHHFPVPQLSLDIARIALDDTEFLNQSRIYTVKNRQKVCENLKNLQNFFFVSSSTNLLMLKHNRLGGPEFSELLNRKGVITSPLNIAGVEGKGYLRIALRDEKDNWFLYKACSEIDKECDDSDRKSKIVNL